MNKKAYITPAMEVTEIATVDMLAASLGYGEGTVDSKTEQLSTDRRGSWGNLWSTGD